MAHVSMADDGNYLVATVYGEWVVSPTSRTGRIRLLKIDNNGNTIWDKKIGPKERNVYLKNLRHTTDGNLILSGWAYNDTVTDWIYEGLLYKFTQEGDSIWMRDYNYFNNQYDQNFFYDASPTSDNGYIAVGQARPDMGGSTNKMWVVKVDSMGCDTPGCATGVWEIEFPEITNGEIMVWPNPVSRKFRVSGFGPGHTEVMLRRPTEGRPSRNIEVWSGGNRVIRIYNSQGLKLDEVKVPDNVESLEIDASGYVNGLYYLQFIVSDKVVQSRKFIKIK
jgi:hypothetical protein